MRDSDSFQAVHIVGGSIYGEWFCSFSRMERLHVGGEEVALHPPRTNVTSVSNLSNVSRTCPFKVCPANRPGPHMAHVTSVTSVMKRTNVTNANLSKSGYRMHLT
jgi:hypothetical protein